MSVNQEIQGGWRTSALVCIPDSSRTSREVGKVPISAIGYISPIEMERKAA